MALVRHEDVPILHAGMIVCIEINGVLTPCVLGPLNPNTGHTFRIIGVEGVYDTFDTHVSYSIDIGRIPSEALTRIIEYDNKREQNISSRWQKIHRK